MPTTPPRPTAAAAVSQMGADAVGLGKPAVYAMAAYGEDGLVKMLDILREELETCLRLVGAPTLAHVTPELVDAAALSVHTTAYRPPASPFLASSAPALATGRAPAAGGAAEGKGVSAGAAAVSGCVGGAAAALALASATQHWRRN